MSETASSVSASVVSFSDVSSFPQETRAEVKTQTNPTLAPYAKTGEVHLRITAKGEDEKSCKKLIKPVVKELQKRFGKNVFALDADKTLEESVVDLLKEKELTLSLAE